MNITGFCLALPACLGSVPLLYMTATCFSYVLSSAVRVPVTGTVAPAVRRLTGSSTNVSAGSWRRQQQKQQQQQQAVVLAAVMGLVLVLLSTLGRNHSAVAHARGAGHNDSASWFALCLCM